MRILCTWKAFENNWKNKYKKQTTKPKYIAKALKIWKWNNHNWPKFDDGGKVPHTWESDDRRRIHFGDFHLLTKCQPCIQMAHKSNQITISAFRLLLLLLRINVQHH